MADPSRCRRSGRWNLLFGWREQNVSDERLVQIPPIFIELCRATPRSSTLRAVRGWFCAP